jgi:hypothetical protein
MWMTTFAEAVPLAGGNMTGALATPAVNGVESPVAGSAQTTLQGGDERGGGEWGDGDSADLCGDGRVHESEWRVCADLRTTGKRSSLSAA